MIAALKSRRLGHLAIDVHEQQGELFFQDRSGDIIEDDIFQRLMTFPNVLVAGHRGVFTVEALREMAEVTLGNRDCCMRGSRRDSPSRWNTISAGYSLPSGSSTPRSLA